MSGAMLHGLGDCTPDRNCGCIGAGDGATASLSLLITPAVPMTTTTERTTR